MVVVPKIDRVAAAGLQSGAAGLMSDAVGLQSDDDSLAVVELE